MSPEGGEVTPRFPVLDALRAIGALAVLTTHVGFYAGAYTDHGVWGSLLSRLDVGVAIFFVLSGFLLSRPYLARAALGLARPATGFYLWKRFLRIYPVYVLAVVLTLLVHPEVSGLQARDWLITLSMLNTFIDPQLPPGLSQMWSLSVEVAFYLILPLLMAVSLGRHRWRPRRVVIVLAAMTAVAAWWHLDGVARSEGLTDGPALQWLPGYLGWFAVGMGLALIHVLGQTGPGSWVTGRVLALAREPGVCWTLAAALMLIATTPVAGPTLLIAPSPIESLVRSTLYAGVGGLVVLSGLGADPATHFSRVLGSAPARRLGITSYSLFCLHLLLLDLIAPALGWALFSGHFFALWGVTVAASLLAAELTYRLVELPVMRWGRRLPPRTDAAATGSATSGTTQR